MSDKLLIPGIEKRMSTLLEIARRNFADHSVKTEERPPTITISREFGCEGFPVAEKLKTLLQDKTKNVWEVMDRDLLAEAAKNHNLSENIFKSLGEGGRSSILDEVISTFSPRWHTERDYFRLLAKQIIALAATGNVIIVGRGSSILTQAMENCTHVRIVAPQDYKTRAIARRLGIPLHDAEEMVRKRQKVRDKFIHDFLGRDAADLSLYHLAFNNEKNSADRIATTIFRYVTE